jgi:hypothetical protein
MMAFGRRRDLAVRGCGRFSSAREGIAWLAALRPDHSVLDTAQAQSRPNEFSGVKKGHGHTNNSYWSARPGQ